MFSVLRTRQAATFRAWKFDLKIEDTSNQQIFIPLFQVGVDIASKTPKQEEDEIDYYPQEGVDENIQKPRSSTSYRKV